MEVKRNRDGLTEQEFLEQYNPGNYERPSVTVDMLILGMNKQLDGMKILLIKRGDHPYMDCWALAGGFVGIHESAYEAAVRELKEETGVECAYLEQLYTMSQPSRDPRMRVIDIAYTALIQTVDVKAGDDAKDALWFDLKFLNNRLVISNKDRDIKIEYKLRKKVFKNGVVKIENYVPELVSEEALAFDHAEIVLEGLMKLQKQLNYTDVAFNLLPKYFTLPDLQRVYEIILGKQLYKANFRKEIASKVVKTDKKNKSITSGVSSTLYRYGGV